MSDTTPPNAAVWFEIPVTNMGGGKALCAVVLDTELAVLDTELKDDNTGPNPFAILPTSDQGVAGHLYPGKPAASGAGNTVHFASPEPLEAALERVKQIGGEVTREIFTIPPGRLAYRLDPDGNSIGLFGR